MCAVFTSTSRSWNLENFPYFRKFKKKIKKFYNSFFENGKKIVFNKNLKSTAAELMEKNEIKLRRSLKTVGE